MNLIPVPVHSNNPITLMCIACGGRAYQARGTVYADLDGAAFQAYYCADCKADIERSIDERHAAISKATNGV